MAQINIDIPNDKIQPAIDLVIDRLNYQDEVDDGEGNMIPNPETHNQFVKRKAAEVVIKWLRHLRLVERNEELDAVPENEFGVS